MESGLSRRRHGLAAVLLVLLLIGFHQWAIPRSHPVAASPGVLFELILPGTFSDSSDAALPVLGAARPPAGRNLPAHVLLPDAESPTRGALYIGLAPLLLAFMAAGAARGGLAWLARAVALLGLVMVCGWVPAGSMGVALLCIGLTSLAGLGLQALWGDAPGGGAPTLVLGAASVALTAGLGALALQAGAVPDTEVVGALLRRLPADELDAWSTSAIASNAAQLRAVLDRSALAAFAVMTALLLHLKGRASWSLALLLLVVAADLVSARFA